jgi:hypothetical protein
MLETLQATVGNYYAQFETEPQAVEEQSVTIETQNPPPGEDGSAAEKGE